MELEQFLQKMEIPYQNIEIFKEAFTHPSYANENKMKNHDYERLEFLGDAVLQYLVFLGISLIYTRNCQKAV